MGFDILDLDVKSGIIVMNYNIVYKVLNYVYY